MAVIAFAYVAASPPFSVTRSVCHSMTSGTHQRSDTIRRGSSRSTAMEMLLIFCNAR